MFGGMVYQDDSCVNWAGRRNDGSYCFDKAAPNGWCERCWAEIAPAAEPVKESVW